MVILVPVNDNLLQPHTFQRVFMNRITINQIRVGIGVPDMFPETRALNDLSRVTQLIETVQTGIQVVRF